MILQKKHKCVYYKKNYGFSKISLYANQINSYIYSLIADSSGKYLSKLIIQRLQNIFRDVKEEIEIIMENKINTIIQNQIEKFKNQDLYLIPKHILEQLKEIIESEYLNNSYSPSFKKQSFDFSKYEQCPIIYPEKEGILKDIINLFKKIIQMNMEFQILNI